MLPLPAYIIQRSAVGLAIGFATGYHLTETTHAALTVSRPPSVLALENRC